MKRQLSGKIYYNTDKLIISFLCEDECINPDPVICKPITYDWCSIAVLRLGVFVLFVRQHLH